MLDSVQPRSTAPFEYAIWNPHWHVYAKHGMQPSRALGCLHAFPPSTAAVMHTPLHFRSMAHSSTWAGGSLVSRAARASASMQTVESTMASGGRASGTEGGATATERTSTTATGRATGSMAPACAPMKPATDTLVRGRGGGARVWWCSSLARCLAGLLYWGRGAPRAACCRGPGSTTIDLTQSVARVQTGAVVRACWEN